MKKVIGKIKNFYAQTKAKCKAFLFNHEQINRIFTLVSILTKNKKRLARQHKTADKIIFFFLKIILVVGMFFVFKFGITYFFNITALDSLSFFDRVPGTYLIFVLFLYLLISIITDSIQFISTMYRAQDNVLLLSYPVNTKDIFISKLIVKLIQEFKKSVLIVCPFLIGVYLDRQGMYSLGGGYIGWTIFLTFIIPALIVFVSGFLSILFTYVSVLFKKINLVKVIFLIAFAVACVVAVIYVVNLIPLHLNIFDLWHQIVLDVNSALIKFNQYLFFSKTIKELLLDNSWASFGIITGVFVAFVLLNIFVSYRFFFSLVYKPIKDKPIRLSRKTKTKQRKNIFLIFLNKEFKTYLRSEDGLVTSIVYILVLPVLLYCLNRVFASFEISAKGTEMIAAINLLISIIIITASNISLGNVISKEGSEFYLLKVTPIETKQIVLAKIIINMILTTIASIGVYVSSKVIMNTTGIVIMSDLNLIAVTIATLFICLAHILWSTELDITHSRIKEVIAGQKDNKNETISVFMGLGLAFVVALAFYFLGRVNVYGFNLKPAVSIIIFATFILIIRTILFVKKLNAYFDEITM